MLNGIIYSLPNKEEAMFKVIAEPQFRESLGKTSEELQEAFEGQLNELASQGWKLVKFE